MGRFRIAAAVVLVYLSGPVVSAGGAESQADPAAARAWHEALAAAAARRAGIDPSLLRALIEVESAWTPDAVSVDGAVGLMQIMPSTAADYAYEPDLANPAVNLAVGVVHLRGLIDRHGVVRALAAWNAGEGALARGRVFSSYGETRRFVALVLQALERLRNPAL